MAHEKGHTKIRDILCAKVSFQDLFIQNVNFILFNWERFFPTNTEERKFIQQLITNIKNLKNADEVFKIVQHALKSPAYNLIQEPLKPVKQLLIQNMKKYNVRKNNLIDEVIKQGDQGNTNTKNEYNFYVLKNH